MSTKKNRVLPWITTTVAVLAIAGCMNAQGESRSSSFAEPATTTSTARSSTASTTSTPSTTKATTTKATTTKAQPSVPAEHRAALRSAETYANKMNMSKKAVYDQLTSPYGGQFPAEAAQYAIDNVVADWNANALASARTYQDKMGMSRAAIHDQLTSEYGGQFTKSQADYALANL